MADIRSQTVPGDGDQSFKDTIVEQCLCGNVTFIILARFHEGEIAGWYTDARCFACGAWYKVPAPTAHEESVVTV